MRIGILSDIHANLPALEAAFQVFQTQGVDRVICAGDLVEKGEHGDEVVAMLEESWGYPRLSQEQAEWPKEALA